MSTEATKPEGEPTAEWYVSVEYEFDHTKRGKLYSVQVGDDFYPKDEAERLAAKLRATLSRTPTGDAPEVVLRRILKAASGKKPTGNQTLAACYGAQLDEVVMIVESALSHAPAAEETK